MGSRSLTKAAVLPLFALTVLGVTGCSGEPGEAQPTQSGAPTSAGQPTSAPSSPAAADSLTAAIDPCSLIDSKALDKLFPEFSPFKRSEATDYDGDGKFAGGRWCDWGSETETASDPYLDVSVGVYDTAGIKDIPGSAGDTKSAKLGSGRQAALTARPPEACFVGLAVGDNARVDILVAGHKEACDGVSLVADEVDPKLPKG